MPFITKINPCFVYLCAWGLVSGLFSLRISYLLDGFSEDFLIVLLVILLTYVCSFYISKYILFFRDSDVPSKLILTSLRKTNKYLLLIWCILSLIDIIASDGITIIWVLQGSGKTYFDFGVNGLHGLSNAIYSVCAMNAYLLSVEQKRKIDKVILGMLLIWPILIVSRQILITTLLQIFFIYTTRNSISIKKITKTIVCALLVVYLFGLVGDIRTGADKFVRLAQPRYDIFYELPSGFLWGGMYLATPIANMQNTYENVEPIDEIQMSISKLIPSPIRKMFFDQEKDVDDGLITQAFNVSSYMSDFYIDYGLPYLLGFTALLGGLSAYIYIYSIGKKNYLGILSYCVLQQMLFLSIFYNHFLYLPICFQYVIIYFVEGKLKYEVIK